MFHKYCLHDELSSFGFVSYFSTRSKQIWVVRAYFSSIKRPRIGRFFKSALLQKKKIFLVLKETFKNS